MKIETAERQPFKPLVQNGSCFLTISVRLS